MIKNSWIPTLLCKSGVSSMCTQILVLAIWHVIGVNIVLCCIVIYASEMMHNYQGVESRAGIYFVHAVYFKKLS